MTLNVDKDEIAKFDALASRWWDPVGEFKPLHDINPIRLDYIVGATAGGWRGKRVLDIGCGGGILAEAMANLGATVTAIDLAPAPLAVARLHAESSRTQVRYLEVSAEAFAQQEPHRFDVVACLEMLEHVPQPDSTIAACGTLARHGADVFFATINRNPASYLFAVLGAEYVLGLLPRGTHDYHKFLRPSELDHFARAAGLQLNDLTGMHYNPLLGSYRLGPGVRVNYLAHYRRTAPAAMIPGDPA